MTSALSYVALLLVGRTLLALLPPGRTGEHALGALPLTWAASHLLGLCALSTQLALCRGLGLELQAWSLLAPWLVVLALRLATLPGAMVPRHAPRPERASLLALGLSVAAAAWALLALVLPRAPHEELTGPVAELARLLAGSSWPALQELLRAASAPALVCLVGHALASVRGAALPRALALVVLAGLIASLRETLRQDETIHAMLASCAGVAFGSEWLLRADRRGLWLACASFAIAPVPEGCFGGLGIAGLVALWSFTPAPARRTATSACGVGLALALALLFVHAKPAPHALDAIAFTCLLALLALCAGLAWIARRLRAGDGAPIARLWIFSVLALGTAAGLLLLGEDGVLSIQRTLPPLALLALGLGLLPAGRRASAA